jgi:outer membrane protein TolC
MMKRGKEILLITFILLCVTTPCMAEFIKLTLEEAIGLGLKNSTSVKTKMLAVYSAQAALQSARSGYYPTISLGVSYTHLFKEQKLNEIYISSQDPVNISTDLSQNIYTFGQLKNAVRMAEEGVKLAEMEFEEEKRELIVEIKRAFYWYILAKEVLNVQEETLQYKEEAFEVARKRYEGGMVPDYEVLSAESDRENFRPQVITAANQVDFALLAVKDLLRIENRGEFEIELIGSLEPEYIQFTKGVLFEEAVKNKYEIQQYRNSLILAELNAAIEKSGNKPVITGFSTYSVQSGYDSGTGGPKYWGKDSWEGVLSAGLSVQMSLSSLFPWSTENADSKKAEIDLEQLRMGLSSVESGIKLEIENILLRLEEEKSKITSGVKGVELASKLFKSASDRYANGLISSIELRDTQISYNNAQLGYITSIYNHKMALFDLMDAIGVYQF